MNHGPGTVAGTIGAAIPGAPPAEPGQVAAAAGGITPATGQPAGEITAAKPESESKPESKQLAIADAPSGSATNELPDFLQGEREGLEEVKKNRAIRNMGIVHGSSKAELKAQFPEGSVVQFPGPMPVCAKDGGVTVTPLIMFETFEKHRDANDSSPGTFILEVTRDPSSEIAKRTRSDKTRTEDYDVSGKRFKYSYSHVYNFVVAVHDGPAAGSVAVVRFQKGEFRTGEFFNDAIARRPCSIYGNRFRLTPAQRTRNSRSWWGFNVNNPPDGMYVASKRDAHAFAEMHKGLRQLVDSGKFEVDLTEDSSVNAHAAEDAKGEGLPDL